MESILNTQIKEVVENPNEIVYHAEIPLDGTDSASKIIQTNLGSIITQAMYWSFDEPVDAALVNGVPSAWTICFQQRDQFGHFRVLPFGAVGACRCYRQIAERGFGLWAGPAWWRGLPATL